MSRTLPTGPRFSIRDRNNWSMMGESNSAFTSFVGAALFAGFAGVERQDGCSR